MCIVLVELVQKETLTSPRKEKVCNVTGKTLNPGRTCYAYFASEDNRHGDGLKAEYVFCVYVNGERIRNEPSHIRNVK